MAPPPALPGRPRPPDKNQPSYSAPFDRAGALRYESSAPRLKAQSRQIDGTHAVVPGVLTCFSLVLGVLNDWFCYNLQRPASAIIFLPAASSRRLTSVSAARPNLKNIHFSHYP